MTIDPFHLYDWIAKTGFPGMLAFFIFVSYTGRILYKREFDYMEKVHKDRIAELLAENKELKGLLRSSQQTASKTIDIASQVKDTTSSNRES